MADAPSHDERKEFKAVTVDLYKQGGTSPKKRGILAQIADRIALLPDDPTGSLQFDVGDELHSQSERFRIIERLQQHCRFGNLPAHYDVRIEPID